MGKVKKVLIVIALLFSFAFGGYNSFASSVSYHQEATVYQPIPDSGIHSNS